MLCEIALQQAFPTPVIGLLLVLFATLGNVKVSLNCAVPSLYLGRILLPVALITMWFLRVGDDLHRILGAACCFTAWGSADWRTRVGSA